MVPAPDTAIELGNMSSVGQEASRKVGCCGKHWKLNPSVSRKTHFEDPVSQYPIVIAGVAGLGLTVFGFCAQYMPSTIINATVKEYGFLGMGIAAVLETAALALAFFRIGALKPRADLEKSINNLNNENETLKTENQVLDGSIVKLRAVKVELDKQLADAKIVVLDLKNIFIANKENIEAMTQRIGITLDQDLKQLKDNIIQYKDINDECQKTIREYSQQIIELQGKIGQFEAQVKRLEKEKAKITAEVKKIGGNTTKITEDKDDLVKGVKSTSEVGDHLSKQNDDLLHKLDDLQKLVGEHKKLEEDQKKIENAEEQAKKKKTTSKRVKRKKTGEVTKK